MLCFLLNTAVILYIVHPCQEPFFFFSIFFYYAFTFTVLLSSCCLQLTDSRQTGKEIDACCKISLLSSPCLSQLPFTTAPVARCMPHLATASPIASQSINDLIFFSAFFFSLYFFVTFSLGMALLHLRLPLCSLHSGK